MNNPTMAANKEASKITDPGSGYSCGVSKGQVCNKHAHGESDAT
jgi:hypothetical protein